VDKCVHFKKNTLTLLVLSVYLSLPFGSVASLLEEEKSHLNILQKFQSLPNSNVQTLKLSGKNLASDEVEQFARYPINVAVSTLDLSDNNLVPEDASQLVRYLKGTKVRNLDLSKNTIYLFSEDIAKSFADKCRECDIVRAVLSKEDIADTQQHFLTLIIQGLDGFLRQLMTRKTYVHKEKGHHFL
jgi:hypothetical protein